MTALKTRVTLVREYGSKQYGDAFARASKLAYALCGVTQPLHDTHATTTMTADAATSTSKLTTHCAELLELLCAHDGLSCYLTQGHPALLPRVVSLVRDAVTQTCSTQHNSDNDIVVVDDRSDNRRATSAAQAHDARALTRLLQLCVHLVDGGVAAELLSTCMTTCYSSLVRLLARYADADEDGSEDACDEHACLAARLLQQAVCATDDAESLAQRLLQSSSSSQQQQQQGEGEGVLWRAVRRGMRRMHSTVCDCRDKDNGSDNDDDKGASSAQARGHVCCTLLLLLRDCIALTAATSSCVAPLCALAQMRCDTEGVVCGPTQRDVDDALLLLLSTAAAASEDDDTSNASLCDAFEALQTCVTRTRVIDSSSSNDVNGDDSHATVLALTRAVCAAQRTGHVSQDDDNDDISGERSVSSLRACVRGLCRSRFDAAARVVWLQRIAAHADGMTCSSSSSSTTQSTSNAHVSTSSLSLLHVLWLLPRGLRSVYACACDVDEDVSSSAFDVLAQMLLLPPSPPPSSSAAVHTHTTATARSHDTDADHDTDDNNSVTRRALDELLLLCGGGMVTLDDALADYSACVVTMALRLLLALLSCSSRTRRAVLASRAVARVAHTLAAIVDRDDCDAYIADGEHVEVLTLLARVLAQLRPAEAAARVAERAVADMSTVVARATAHVTVVRAALRALVLLATAYPLPASMAIDYEFVQEQLAQQLARQREAAAAPSPPTQKKEEGEQANNNHSNDNNGSSKHGAKMDEEVLCAVNAYILSGSLDMLTAVVTCDARAVAFESIESVGMALSCVPYWLQQQQQQHKHDDNGNEHVEDESARALYGRLAVATCRCALAMLRASDECRTYLLYDDVQQSIATALQTVAAVMHASARDKNTDGCARDDGDDADEVTLLLLQLASYTSASHVRTHTLPALVAVARARCTRAALRPALLDAADAAAAAEAVSSHGDAQQTDSAAGEHNGHDDEDDDEHAVAQMLVDVALYVTCSLVRDDDDGADKEAQQQRQQQRECLSRVARLVSHVRCADVALTALVSRAEEGVMCATHTAADAHVTTRRAALRLLHALLCKTSNDDDDSGQTIDNDDACASRRAARLPRALHERLLRVVDAAEEQQHDADAAVLHALRQLVLSDTA